MSFLKNPNVHAAAAMVVIAIIGFSIPSFFGSKREGESGKAQVEVKPRSADITEPVPQAQPVPQPVPQPVVQPMPQPVAKNEAVAEASNESRIQGVAETMVLERLKSPDTARFEPVKILKAEDPWYQALAVVHAQNSFGAMIRERYVCTFKLGLEDKFSCSPRWGVQQYRDFGGADGYEEAVATMLEMYRDESDWGKTSGP